jgi:hypothetical protein
MNESKNFISVISIIALRKSTLYKSISDKENVDSKRLEDYISRMNNKLFISAQEKQAKKIDPNLNIEELEIDVRSIINNVSTDAKTI